MTFSNSSPASNSSPTPVSDPAAARDFCVDLAQTVDSLIAVLNEETSLIRAARLTAAAEVSARKSVVAERYMKAHGVLSSAGAELNQLVPDEVGHLRERHQALESAISLNLAVLATARTVSETLIRDVAGLAAARQGGQTQTYGANARQTETAPRAAPLSYNVAL
ncbi:hypothetical protein [Microbaculum marinisediminis]|uniref:Flagellar protein FlgN n=1 Tax=Microbaculum marinisediminis TaxID=2931392 RepID=A0AAW5QZ19_9HYPH|nr:hypothetical protein [Microbaculum sp. A6E488]MCT8972819.1 hypothetical protein [Microbaculum sp. A6E488]